MWREDRQWAARWAPEELGNTSPHTIQWCLHGEAKVILKSHLSSAPLSLGEVEEGWRGKVRFALHVHKCKTQSTLLPPPQAACWGSASWKNSAGSPAGKLGGTESTQTSCHPKARPTLHACLSLDPGNGLQSRQADFLNNVHSSSFSICTCWS